MPSTPQETFRELTERVEQLVMGDSGQARGLAGLYAEPSHVSFPHRAIQGGGGHAFLSRTGFGTRALG